MILDETPPIDMDLYGRTKSQKYMGSFLLKDASPLTTTAPANCLFARLATSRLRKLHKREQNDLETEQREVRKRGQPTSYRLLSNKPGFHIVARVCDHHRRPVGVPSQTYGNAFFSVADGLRRLMVMVGK